MKTLIKNGYLVKGQCDSKIGYVLFEEGKILEVGYGEKQIADDESFEIIDAQGNYISAGFIDIHTHGGGGADFMDGTIEAFLTAARMHAQHGTTLIFPTTLASTNEQLFKLFDIYESAVKANTDGAQFGGLHLEGPYFAYEFRGAQDPKHLRNPAPEEYMEMLERSKDIVRWSMAPELPGALEFASELTKRGILPAIAHSNALFEEVIEAHKCGFKMITHFFSCCSTISRCNAFRFGGVLEAGYYLDDMTLEIICDGIHVPESLLKMIYKMKGADNLLFVTDSMRGAGMPDGVSILGSLDEGQKVLIEDGVAKLMDKSAFAGSVATTDRLVRTANQIGGIPLYDCIKMMCENPAREMNILDKKGTLDVGKDADIVIFDKDICVKNCIINGIKIK